MKKFLVGCLLLVSTIALADAPVIWNGTTAKWLPSGLRSLGVAKISSTGVMTSGDISNVDVSATASIATSKLAALTASKVAVTDASGFLTASTVNSSDLSLLSGLSSSLANKWDITGNASLNASTNFLGTTDAVDVVFKRNNTELARLQSNGLQAATIYGSSSSGGNLTVRSSSNATVGSVILADQALEKFRVGPTGSTTTYNYSHHVLTTNASALTNALVVQENSSNVPTTIASAGPQSFIFAPKDSGGTSTIITRVSGADYGQWYVVRATDGSLMGYMNYGLGWGIGNFNTAHIPFRVTGTTGQTADLTQWHNTNSFGGTVASIGANGNIRGPSGAVGTPGFAFQGDTNNGWWAPAADTQAWSLAGSEALRLDSTGLGIGATASTKLDVNGGARIRGLTTAGPVKTDATGVLSQSAVNLATEVTGDLPYANFTQSAGLSVLGRATNSTGDVADITAGSDDQVLRRSGTSLAFGQVATGGLADASVTAAKANSQFVQGQTTVTADTTDYVLIADSSDSGNIKKALISDIAGSGSADAVTKDIAQTGHGFSVGDVIRHNGTIYVEADASADATSEVYGVVSAVPNANNFTVTTSGYITGLTGLTAGSAMYLSETSGAVTVTAPATTGTVNKPVLLADSTTSGYVKIQRGYVNGSGSSGGGVSDWVASSATVNCASAGTTELFERMEGDSLRIRGTFSCTTAGTGTPSINIGGGRTFNTSKMQTIAPPMLGVWHVLLGGSAAIFNGTQEGHLFYDLSDNDDVFLATTRSGKSYTKITNFGSIMGSLNSEAMNIDLLVPIN